MNPKSKNLMDSDNTSNAQSMKSLGITMMFIHLAWILLMGILLGWNIWDANKNLDHLIHREAQIRLQTANHIRQWIVSFGGVYAPISEHHQPNQLIPAEVGRDVETVDGRKLTIANSISALNTIIGKDNRVEGGYVRFTGYEPLKPDNAPDSWEQDAIKRLTEGEKLVAEYTTLENKPYFRMIQPLPIKPKCYKCHSYQSYKLGDIAGGLEINVDLSVYKELETNMYKTQGMIYGGIWLIGVLGFSIAGKYWKRFLQEKEVLNHQLEELATHDQLTGFLNRHQLKVVFDNELAQAKRKQQPLSLLMVDIDKFKDINDNFGHISGDKVLREISKIVGHCIRSSDYVFRYGGDELLFLMPDTNHENLLNKAEKLLTMMAETPIEIKKGTNINVTFSIGAATFPYHGDDDIALVESVDRAVYLAKDGGRNQVRSADEVSI